MAEETLVKESLSSEMINAGERLVEALDQAGVPVEAALWLYVPELNLWRLLIGSSRVMSDGPKRIYLQLQSILSGALATQSRVNIQDVSVVDLNTPIMAAVSSMIRTGPEISDLRFSRNTINGMYIADSYIYRLPDVINTTASRPAQYKKNKEKRPNKQDTQSDQP